MDVLDPVMDLSTQGPIHESITSKALGMYTLIKQNETIEVFS